VEIRHIRKDEEGRNIGHEYRLLIYSDNDAVKGCGHEPQILMGASNSSKMGWLMNSSRAFVQRYLISYS
jgi:hypothetical protein